jgi:hypothetical protein
MKDSPKLKERKKQKNFFNLDLNDIKVTIDDILDKAKTTFHKNFMLSSFINTSGKTANTILCFNENKKYEGSLFVPGRCFGNSAYFNHIRIPKKQRLGIWLGGNLQANDYKSNFLHIILQTGSNPQTLFLIEEYIQVLNKALGKFIRNLKNNFPVVNYVSTMEVSINGLPHIHFLVELKEQLSMIPTRNDKGRGDNLMPTHDIVNKINKIWNKALKKASKELEVKYNKVDTLFCLR